MKFTVQHELRELSHRHQLPAWLTAKGLTGQGVEVGTFTGHFASMFLSGWTGQLTCVDPWVNQPKEKYFDGANLSNMEEVFTLVQATLGKHPRCRLMRTYSLVGAQAFPDGELDWVYLDGNHAVDSVRADIRAWWPKVKVGGLFAGHDYCVRYDHETNSDALTAVAELSEKLEIRAHVTWCTSWYFLKTPEANQAYKERYA